MNCLTVSLLFQAQLPLYVKLFWIFVVALEVPVLLPMAQRRRRKRRKERGSKEHALWRLWLNHNVPVSPRPRSVCMFACVFPSGRELGCVHGGMGIFALLFCIGVRHLLLVLYEKKPSFCCCFFSFALTGNQETATVRAPCFGSLYICQVSRQL